MLSNDVTFQNSVWKTYLYMIFHHLYIFWYRLRPHYIFPRTNYNEFHSFVSIFHTLDDHNQHRSLSHGWQSLIAGIYGGPRTVWVGPKRSIFGPGPVRRSIGPTWSYRQDRLVMVRGSLSLIGEPSLLGRAYLYNQYSNSLLELFFGILL